MIYVIGMGPGNVRHITYEAVERMKSTPTLLAFGRIGETARQIHPKVVEIKRVEEVLDYLGQDGDIAILASGDPCFYGIVEFLKNKGIKIDEVIPGVSSFQYMMAKLKKSWNDATLISFHGRVGDVDKIVMSRLTVILTDSKNTPNEISALLHQHGMKGRIYAGFNLSYDNEVIVCKKIGEDIVNISNLATVVIENEMD